MLLGPNGQPLDRVEAVAGALFMPKGPPVDIGENKVQDWQIEAWRYWKCLGELHYPTTRMARSVGRLGWFVKVNGDMLEEAQAKPIIDGVSEGIGIQEATRMVALNLMVAGDGWYIEDTDGFGVFSVITRDLYERIEKAKSAGRVAMRFFNADPVDPTLADSSVRTALGPAEELMTLQSLTLAQSRSRIAQAGIFLVPAEQKFSEGDPFGEDLERAMMTPIADERHPSAMVPIKVEMDSRLIPEANGGPRHITFDRPYDEHVEAKIELAVRRVAMALDIPPELLLGIGTLTFWNAWAVSLDAYQAHAAPIADLVGELYGAVAEKLILEAENREVTVEFIPDPSEVFSRRSTVRDALDALRSGAVGFEYVREAIGATDEDAPTTDEIELLLELRGRNDERRPRVGENPGPARSEDNVAASLNGDLKAAMEVAYEVAKAKVGAKLRSKHQNRRGAEIDGVANCDVPRLLSDELDSIDVELTVMSALEPFRAWWATHQGTNPDPAATLFGLWIADNLTTSGVPDQLVDELSTNLIRV